MQAGDGRSRRPRARAFTLLEVLTALAILGLTCSSVLLVINQCMASAANCALRMEAFQVARENLEKVLASDSVSETVEYGTSEQYSGIDWRTVIEAFSEPMTGQMWVRAVCSADYIDSTGETQTIELIHWIGSLTAQQADQLLQDEDLETLAAEQVIDSVEEAAEYAGVNADTVEQWVENGLQLTDEGAFIKYNLDIYMQGGGEPSETDKARQVRSIEELAVALSVEEMGEESSENLEDVDATDTTIDSSIEERRR